MNARHQKGGWIAVGALLVVADTLLPGLTSDAADEDTGARVKPVFAQGLPNAPGKELTAVVVTYAPGWQVAAASSCRQRFRLRPLGRYPLGELGDRTRQGLPRG